MTFISSLSISTPLQQSVMQAQAAMTVAQTETISGTLADEGLSLGSQTGTLLSLQSQIDRLTSLTNSNSAATTRLATTSTAIDSLISGAQNISQDLVTASSSGGLTSSLQTTAQGALQTMIAALNSSTGGQYVFGGINSSKAPIQDYLSTPTSSAKTAVDTAFANELSSTGSTAATISGTDMTSFLNSLDAQFTGSSWQQNWSSASSQTIQSTISPSQSISTSVSANQSAFQQIAEAYTMLTEFSGSNMSTDASAAVVSKASSLVSTALASLTNIQAGVGLAQNAITNANSTMSSQVTVLQTSVGDMDNVNTYDLSNKVTQLQTQLEASFELTSQLHQLSLVNYLTAG